MKNNKFLLVFLVLVLSVSIGFAQGGSKFTVCVLNASDVDYETSANFTSGGNFVTPIVGDPNMEIPSEDEVCIKYEFTENNVILECLRAYYPPNSPPPIATLCQPFTPTSA
ncbi:MAG: hypothetical protein HN704_10765 [Bacteroidetes bacterium]|jgi:hypothetical protein|nr:hypothetical protein [Bacteroidota bacterium]MBT6688060.1 hypothetical protein [Bacteroidota bacterium]MBT7145012.1 hypothetical protein [Bacteroidota bacterium]MBT7492074.1 hypothetical protein [Bacteroidota bacterium]